jgi:hypothetical protein
MRWGVNIFGHRLSGLKKEKTLQFLFVTFCVKSYPEVGNRWTCYCWWPIKRQLSPMYLPGIKPVWSVLTKCDKTDFILSAIQLETNLNVEFKRVIGRQFFKNYFDLPSFWDTSDHSLSLCDRHVSLLISMINRSEDKFLREVLQKARLPIKG